MSNGIRKYDPDTEWYDEAQQMDVRAVMGSLRTDPRDGKETNGHGRSVQLTIGSNFTILTEKQVLDLIGVLSKRLSCEDNFSATALMDEKTVQADGTKEVGETSW